MHARLGQHGVVLQFGLAQRGAVARNQNQLGYGYKRTWMVVRTFALAQGLEGRLVAQRVLAALHDQRQAGVDGLDGLFLRAIRGA